MKEAIIERFQGRWKDFYIAYLPNMKRQGKQYMATCPFHAETKPSFSVNNDDGRYFCHGCNKQGDAFHFYAKRKGLTTRDDFPQVLEGICKDFHIPTNSSLLRRSRTETNPPQQAAKSKGQPEGDPTEIYPYTDANGNLIFEVCRYSNPKSFRMRRPKKVGQGYKWGIADVERVLYNLPYLVTAQEIWLVEGEADANNLDSLGFTATTAPGGAGKWRPSYTETLAGKDVIICPDNDEAGSKHANKVAEKLHGVAKSVKVIRLPDLPPSGDVSDFIAEKGGERGGDKLEEIAEDTKPWHPIDANPLAVQLVDDLLTEHIPDNWLVENLISAEECGFISGGPKWGKSIFAQNLAMCMAGGHTFLNTFPVVRSCKVLYINLEISKKNFQRRFQIMKENAEFTYPPENLIHITLKGMKLDSQEMFSHLAQQVGYHKPDVVIVDCLYRAVRMSLDKHDTTAPFLDNLSKLIEDNKCTVIIVHHYRKPTKKRKFAYGAGEMAGSYALHGFGDFYITFKAYSKNRDKLTLNFEMRNCEEPNSITVIRNPETLWYEYAGETPEERGKGRIKEGSIWDVVDAIKEHDTKQRDKPSLDRPTLIVELERKLDVSASTAKKRIIEAEMDNYIKVVNPRARPKVYANQE
jgi:hypothetical protein